ncbi:MAG: PEP/pyruvate-binding domain-containing protein [Candidatus Azambacteria bacterium]|nr:PEP/pyruvate-binding domain-containing protein [Candidatus Azambacteria bacterium]
MKKDIATLGGKGASLVKMTRAGIPVPPFFIIPAGAFDKKEILAEFKKLKTKYVAVRSSATAEDSLSASWAGQLESYLNVTEKNLLESIEKCRASIDSPRAKAYRTQKKLNKKKISVAVIIQKMVQSETSGICFTANPVTGDRNEMVIEAGQGLGEAIVGGKITPKTYIINKKSIGFGNLSGLAKLCLEIEKLFKYPQDIEWAIAKGKIYILQSRPITTL